MAVSTANVAPNADIIGTARPRTSSRSCPWTTRLTNRWPRTAAATVTTRNAMTSTHSGAATSQFTSSLGEGDAVVVARRVHDLVAQDDVDVLEDSLHGDRLQAAGTVVERTVQESEEAQHGGDRRHDRSHHEALDHRALATVGEEQQEQHDQCGAEEHDEPQRDREDALGAVDPVVARFAADGVLLQPHLVCRLLGVAVRLDRA